MQKFTPLSRKTLLNHMGGWEFISSINVYPIIVYVNLHNINNHNLHQLKNYMSTINGKAQVLNTHQLTHLFGKNIKFKFMTTGNIIALMFHKWADVWNFNNNWKNYMLLVSTISVEGTFLNVSQHLNCLEFLENIYNQNQTLTIKTTMQISCSNNDVYSCLNQPINTTVNTISLVLYQLASFIEKFSKSVESLKTN